MSQQTAIVFDPHAWNHKRHGNVMQKGINRRGQLCLNVLQSAVQIANQHDANLIVAGDLVDNAGPVQPQFAVALRDTLAGCRNGVSLLLGNHDMTADGDHSLGLYEGTTLSANMGVIVKAQTEIAWLYDEWLRTYACLVPFHRDIRDEQVRDVPLLVAHFGVYDDSFPPWLKNSPGAWHVDKLFEFMKERNISACCLGDWHQRAAWFNGKPRECNRIHSHTNLPFGFQCLGPDDKFILQGGALSATGHDNPGLTGYGTVALWDGKRLSWQELPGPRFCVARSADEEAALLRDKGDNKLFLRRYYSGERPPTPEGLEAYELLPIKVEQLAAVALDSMKKPKEQLQQLVSEWLFAYDDLDTAQMTEIIKGYLK